MPIYQLIESMIREDLDNKVVFKLIKLKYQFRDVN